MFSRTRNGRRLVATLVASVIFVGLVALGCSETEDPFVFGEREALREGRATPTPEKRLVTQGQDGSAQAREEAPPADSEPAAEVDRTVKIVGYRDKSVGLYNYIAGYILSHGYEYDVELVTLKPEEFQAALADGRVDVAMSIDKATSGEWYEASVGNGPLIDIGSLWQTKPDSRVVVHTNLKERAPAAVELLGKMVPGDAVLDDMISKIPVIRGGAKPSVAGLKFLKDHGDIWKPWVSEEAAMKVLGAIDIGRVGMGRTEVHDPGSA